MAYQGRIRTEREGRTWVFYAVEHVWLLNKTGAPTQFLVFGNDRSVPASWLKRYGHMAAGVAFYFLTDSGDLEKLR